MAVILSSPRDCSAGSSASCRTIGVPYKANPFHGSVGATGLSSMPLTIVAAPTIVAPPSAIRCASASRSRRSSATAGAARFTLRSAHHLRGVGTGNQQPKPPSSSPRPAAGTSVDGLINSPRDLGSSATDDSNPLRLPNIPTHSPQHIGNARTSSSDTVLTSNKTSINEMPDSTTNNGIGNVSPVHNKGSIFPNFRILQRLATSARLRSAKKSAAHSNAKKASKRRSTPPTSEDNPDLESVCVHATGLNKSFDEDDCEYGDIGDTKYEVADDIKIVTNDTDDDPPNNHTSRRKRHTKGAKKLKRSLSARLRLKRRGDSNGSKTPKPKSPSIRFSLQSGSNVGSLAVPSLMGSMIHMEPKKVEIYSTRYNKQNGAATHKEDWDQRVGSNSKDRVMITKKRPNAKSETVDVDGCKSLRHFEQASAVYGVLPCQIQDSSSSSGGPGLARKKAPSSNKITRIFLSEKQSSSMRDGGKLFPCPPPCSPTAEMLKNVEYVPSLSDLRSQRAIRNRLVTMEKEAKERRQRRLEEAKKQEKQLQRDHVAVKKYRQRQEIYALNKIMTELELKHFEEFCKTMNKVSEKES